RGTSGLAQELLQLLGQVPHVRDRLGDREGVWATRNGSRRKRAAGSSARGRRLPIFRGSERAGLWSRWGLGCLALSYRLHAGPDPIFALGDHLGLLRSRQLGEQRRCRRADRTGLDRLDQLGRALLEDLAGRLDTARTHMSNLGRLVT